MCSRLGVVLLLLGSGLGGMGLATSVTGMIAALIVQQTAAGMTVPTLIAWTQSKYGFEHRGRGMGIWTAAFFLAQSQSPRLVHAIDAQAGSMQGAFLAAGMVGLAGAVAALECGSSLHPQPAEVSLPPAEFCDRWPPHRCGKRCLGWSAAGRGNWSVQAAQRRHGGWR